MIQGHVKFGEFLKRERINRGMTQEELAGALGVFQPWVSRIEGGFHSPTMGTIERVLEALEIPVSDFFNAN